MLKAQARQRNPEDYCVHASLRVCFDTGSLRRVVSTRQLIGCGYLQEFLDGAKNPDNAHARRLVWDAYAENTSGRRL